MSTDKPEEVKRWTKFNNIKTLENKPSFLRRQESSEMPLNQHKVKN